MVCTSENTLTVLFTAVWPWSYLQATVCVPLAPDVPRSVHSICQRVSSQPGGPAVLKMSLPQRWCPMLVQAHRDGCMCIICKQARRVGRTWGGMSGMAGGPRWQGPMLTAGRRGQPVPRFGKRAFLHALPHLVCGPLRHKVVCRCCCC